MRTLVYCLSYCKLMIQKREIGMHAPEPLLLDLLASLKASGRPYADVMEAWRTSCPRLPVWEDAVDLGLVQCSGREVFLTDAGRRRLANAR